MPEIILLVPQSLYDKVPDWYGGKRHMVVSETTGQREHLLLRLNQRLKNNNEG